MALKLTNNGTSTLAGSITDVATSLTVQAGDAGKYPALGAGDWCPATLTDASGNLEVVRVTARAGAVLTITRAQEGTAARAWASGDRIDLRMTAAALAALETPDAIHDATPKTTLVAADEFSLWDSVASAFKKITFTNLYTQIALGFASLTAKTSLVDADLLHLNDSAASSAGKAITWANFKTAMFTAWGALTAAGTAKATPVDADGVAIADSAASNATKLLTFTNLWANYLKGKADALYQPIHARLTSLAGLAFVAGDLIYATASTTLARLAIGTNGQVLTLAAGVPSWADAASGGMTLLGTLTMSGSTVALTSIPATYRYLYFRVVGVSDNAGNNMRVEISSTNGAAYGANVQLVVLAAGGNTANGWFAIHNYCSAVAGGKILQGGLSLSGAAITTLGATITTNTAAAMDAVRFSLNTGNYDAGTIEVYGVK